MKKNSKASGFIFLICSILIFNTAYGKPGQQTASSGSIPFLLTQLKQTAFEENKGQIEGTDAARVIASYQAGDFSIFLMKSGFTYQFNRTVYPKGYKFPGKNGKRDVPEQRSTLEKEIQLQTYRMDVTFLGANADPEIIMDDKNSEWTNYYNKQVLNIHSFNRIIYRNVYPNIDWVIYKSGDNIKYDFIVRPNGNPANIALQVSDAEQMELDKDGGLIINNKLGSIKEQKPISFQGKNTVSSCFKIRDNVIRFELGAYDHARPLTIDPSISWATYYGGNTTEYGQACATDNNGNVYLAGSTKSNTGIAEAGFSNSYGGGTFDAFLVKFNNAGQRLWATYYGGNMSDLGNGCATDKNGNVYLSGYTESSANISTDMFQELYGGGGDAFLVKFNSDGQRQWATYFGQGGYDAGYGCTTDASGNVFLAGRTNSVTDMNFYGFQNDFGGAMDAFLAKFSGSGQPLWSTYYGGAYEDEGMSCATDRLGNVYLAGNTGSDNNIATDAAGHGGTWDGFIVKFKPSGQRVWGTYVGAADEDYAAACAVDANCSVYIAGTTASDEYIARDGFQNNHGGSDDAYLAKFDSAGIFMWSTYYGGHYGDFGTSCVVDPAGNIYMGGYTNSENNIASGGFQDSLKNWQFDAFAAKFNSNGQRIWGTYYGGNLSDFVTSCALDNSGNLYLAGYTQSTDIEVPAAYQADLSGEYDALLMQIKQDGGTAVNEKNAQAADIYVYPNPASDKVYIQSPVSVDVSLCTPGGKQIIYERSAKSISVEGLIPGLYLLIVRDKHGSFIKAEKFVKL